MGPAQAAAFDDEAHQLLQHFYADGMVTFQVTGSVLWGLPLGC
jgi:hypothetical protein